MEWLFMYLLPDSFAPTPERAVPSCRFGLIHCALRARVPASSGSRSSEQNLKFNLVAILNCPVHQKVRKTVPSVAVAPLEWGAGGACTRSPPTAYGWKSAPKAPRIGPRVSPTPKASPVRLQLPMMPSGPSASWPTNIPSSLEESAVASLRST